MYKISCFLASYWQNCSNFFPLINALSLCCPLTLHPAYATGLNLFTGVLVSHGAPACTSLKFWGASSMKVSWQWPCLAAELEIYSLILLSPIFATKALISRKFSGYIPGWNSWSSTRYTYKAAGKNYKIWQVQN